MMESIQQTNPFLFPPEIVGLIFDHLPVWKLAKLCMINKSCNELIHEKYLKFVNLANPKKNPNYLPNEEYRIMDWYVGRVVRIERNIPCCLGFYRCDALFSLMLHYADLENIQWFHRFVLLDNIAKTNEDHDIYYNGIVEILSSITGRRIDVIEWLYTVGKHDKTMLLSVFYIMSCRYDTENCQILRKLDKSFNIRESCILDIYQKSKHSKCPGANGWREWIRSLDPSFFV